ncbi:MAG TPA: hypothetical protein VFM68_00030 [Candidatus Saccharimonadales bacterium]|nr:hypothetical protein [Candidatus Saccharimonadales bacterium]
MVHGFNSNPTIWDRMRQELSSLKNISTSTFDYENVHSEWVTNEAIGPELAMQIDCLAQASLQNGGQGKVIVVAHSMGGLATRYATNQTIDGRKVADEVGLVITLGTPHLGSLWGNTGTAIGTSVCQGVVGNLTFNPLLGLLMSKDMCLSNLAMKGLSKSSRELRELPSFPADIPVRAIAGNTRVYVQLLFTEIVKTGTSSDLVVGVESATAEYTDTDRGDGRFEFRCDLRRYEQGVNTGLQGGECSHNELYTTGYIQESVKQGIEEYLAVSVVDVPKITLPSGREKTLFNKLTLTYPDTWGGAMNNPGVVENIVDYTHCEDIAAVCPHIHFINLDSAGGRAQYGDDPVASAAEQASTMGFPSGYVATGPAELKGTVSVGGETADYYEQIATTTHAPPQTRFYYWYIESRQLLITAYDSDYGPYSAETLSAVLDNVEWR